MNKSVTGECQNCESSFDINYTEEFVSEEYPQFCPFCGESIDELSEEYIEDDESDDDEDKWN
jgi:hypothetical protein